MTTPVETPAPATKRIHGAWYSLVALPGLLAIFVLATQIPRLIHGFADLRKKTFTTVPEEAEILATTRADRLMNEVTLHAGENMIYVEGVKIADETEAKAELSCELLAQTHAIPLERDTSTTMTLRSTSYVSQFSAQIDEAGEYNIGCTATSATPVQYAIGRSFPFIAVVWILLALFLALPLTGVVGYLVHRIRNGKRKTARIT